MSNPSEMTNLTEVVAKIEELLIRAKELADEDAVALSIDGADFYYYYTSDDDNWNDSWDDSGC